MSQRLVALVACLVIAACTTTTQKESPIERIDDGIYHIAVDGGDTEAGTRREVANLWQRAARSVCPNGFATIEEHATTETSDNVGVNMFGLPVAPGGTKTVNTKSGYVRCDDSPYGLADATFIVRDIRSSADTDVRPERYSWSRQESQLPTCASPGKSSTRPLPTGPHSKANTRLVLFVSLSRLRASRSAAPSQSPSMRRHDISADLLCAWPSSDSSKYRSA